MSTGTVKTVEEKEEVPKPVVKAERPLFDITYTKCEKCGSVERSLEILKQRVLEAGLKPLQHRAPCLTDKKQYFGLFGSVLKGTYIANSDIDYAVVMPGDFENKLDKYVKGVLDRVFYLFRTTYGWIAVGEIADIDVELYYVRPNVKFHTFEVDGEVACRLSDTDRQTVRRVKELGKYWGVYGKFGGVPGIAIELSTIYARERGVALDEALRWHYIPLPGLSNTVAGNAVGRTFRVNQEILADLVAGKTPADPPTENEKYVYAVSSYAKRYNYAFEYFVVRENLPIAAVYMAYVSALADVLGADRVRYIGREVGVFGPVGYNGYVMGIAMPAAAKEIRKYGVAPDRISLVTPQLCSLSQTDGIRLEGGLVCASETIGARELRTVVATLYERYRQHLATIYDQHVRVKLI
ncbi:MAG: nucleotidyltransferase domain-containing protein [Pyrobaculum sp.]